jgi:hypothetical protein
MKKFSDTGASEILTAKLAAVCENSIAFVSERVFGR